MVCFALQVPAFGGSVICGGIGAAIDAVELDCENITTTFANHFINDRIWFDDYG